MLLSRANLKKHLTRRHHVAKPMADAMIRTSCVPQGPSSSQVSVVHEASDSTASQRVAVVWPTSSNIYIYYGMIGVFH